MTDDGVFVVETNDPHTQLGMEEGSKGKYAKAREFGYNGKPIRDIHFTDHGRAHDHTCPHQHIYDENPTGGSFKYGDPVPCYLDVSVLRPFI